LRRRVANESLQAPLCELEANARKLRIHVSTQTCRQFCSPAPCLLACSLSCELSGNSSS
jgi:hypothetical protein